MREQSSFAKVFSQSIEQEIQSMLSQIPMNFEKATKEDLDREILRAGIIAELDAINLYEQMAAMTGNEDIKKILLEIARERRPMWEHFRPSC